jgi:hypothetical protein
MKIARIIKNQSVPGQHVAFETEPALSRPVFLKFKGMGFAECFRFENGLLVMDRTHFNEIDENFYAVTQRTLTAAEEAVEQDQDNAKRAQDQFVNTISAKTGIPIAESAQNESSTNQE